MDIYRLAGQPLEYIGMIPEARPWKRQHQPMDGSLEGQFVRPAGIENDHVAGLRNDFGPCVLQLATTRVHQVKAESSLITPALRVIAAAERGGFDGGDFKVAIAEFGENAFKRVRLAFNRQRLLPVGNDAPPEIKSL